jgi:lysophospholipase L1-like esterase
MRWRFAVDLLQKSKPAASRPHYGHVIILGGVNDLAAGSVTAPRVTRIERNLTWMYQKGHALGMKVIAVTVPPWGKLRGSYDKRADATRALNQWILGRTAGHAVDHAVDIHPLLGCGDEDVLCPSYRRFPDDQVHWGPPGHRVVADALFREVFADCK